MTTETTPCVHTQRQQETRVLEAIGALLGPFFHNGWARLGEIQARTGIAPSDLAYLLTRMAQAGALEANAVGYRVANCPHDPAFHAMQEHTCLYCGLVWP